MSWFKPKHQHQWKVTGAVFRARPEDLRTAKGMTQELFEQVLYGSTLLTQQCVECGWVSVSRVAGKPDLRGVGVIWADTKAEVAS